MMISPGEFIHTLNKNGLGPFMGVPCSILAPVLNYILDNPSEMEYYNPANEAHALGLAAGFYLGSKKIPVVFLQNSGFGNIIDPLTSMHQIYRIPVFLLITWPGFDGQDADAPEHSIMGRDLEDYLKISHLPYEILTEKNYGNQIAALRNISHAQKIPVAAVMKRNLCDSYKLSVENKTRSEFQRHDAIKIIKESLETFTFLSTNGITSRESFAVRGSPDFYMIGSMGLVSAIGCGTALS
jgi:phosphonopyruvate decarboxylase